MNATPLQAKAACIAEKIIADYLEHYDFPWQGESHMHDCITEELEKLMADPLQPPAPSGALRDAAFKHSMEATHALAALESENMKLREQASAEPHGPVGERFMRHNYGASGYAPQSAGPSFATRIAGLDARIKECMPEQMVKMRADIAGDLVDCIRAQQAALQGVLESRDKEVAAEMSKTNAYENCTESESFVRTWEKAMIAASAAEQQARAVLKKWRIE